MTKLISMSISFSIVLSGFFMCLQTAFAQNQNVTRTNWEMNAGKGVFLLEKAVSGLGSKDNYLKANIPDESDSGWGPAPDPATINFGGPYESAIPKGNCRMAVDYTYFQTFVTLPKGGKINEFKIAFDGMDDGSRISIYNKTFPKGTIVEGSYVISKGNGTSDLKELITEGRNRVVITQVDACPVGNQLHSASVTLNGEVITPAPELPKVFKLLAYSINNKVRGSTDAAPDFYVTPENGIGRIIEGVDNGMPFEIISINNETIALRVTEGPYKGKYLTGEDNKATFSDDISNKNVQFIVRPPLERSAGDFVSFESVALPGQYLRHQSFDLKLDIANKNSPSLLRRDATFRYKAVKGISIEYATYGENCGASKGNATAGAVKLCNGLSNCELKVTTKVFGDPKVGCSKNFEVHYICPNGETKTAKVKGEASHREPVQLSCDTDTNKLPEGEVPIVRPISLKHAPVLPSGMKLACKVGPNSNENADSCPVIWYNSINFWPFSYKDDRHSIGFVAYANHKILKQTELKGTRHAWKIVVNKDNQTVTIIGQNNKAVSTKWADMVIN